ncbi:DUF4864 domain-containing protein [Neptuniibacter sp. CAU 1671]|uniref:DUF4864 domain-containing protein n=1 Tax=Neptuniibacter sp. CAU 1671 TaxID=3032593 RepID=UPI0023D9C5E7|nr:DUF4864 domain-containing protein [Neptuniibacter sp. CAU 1671]MDF2180520.1 DUF4864 domain-containing protein [Neptuniibacter sp. CAU 1671]
MRELKMLSQSLLLAICLSTSSAFADTIIDIEGEAARATISGQIAAFLKNDNETAYSYAAPIIKQQFPNVEIFMLMVVHGFQPVWKPKNYAFGKAIQIGPEEIMQQVFLTGPDGKPYEALYTLTKQKEGDYKISAVRIIEATAA